MATLEKIRSKSVLLVVIIAVALLAFILGDAITNGRNLFGNNTTVAKIGGEKIEIPEYQQKQQELSQQLEDMRRQNPAQVANFDNQVLSQMAVSQLVNDKLFNKAVGQTGIKVTPELLKFYMMEEGVGSQYVQDLLPRLQNLIMNMSQVIPQVQDPTTAHMVISNPTAYGISEQQIEPYRRAWVALEAVYGERIAQVAYLDLLQNSYKANDLDIAAMKRDYNATAQVKVAKKPYTDIEKYKVDDKEIEKAYNDSKEEYKIDEISKQIGFIAVSVSPSDDDVKKATVLADQVVVELKSDKGVSKETRKEGLDVQRHEMRLADVRDMTLKTFLESDSLGSVSVISNSISGFTVAKLNKRTQQVDSVEIGMISVQGSKKLIDEVLAYANSGAVMDSINNKFSADSVYYQKPADKMTPLYTASGKAQLGIADEVFDSLFNSNGKYIVMMEQPGAAMLGTISKKSAPTQVVEYETVDYVLQPSEATLAQKREELQKYIDANNTASKFVENAQKDNYALVELMLTPSTPAIPRFEGANMFFPDSRSVARWVIMDAKDGQVSKIYQSKDAAHPMLYAAALIDTYEDYIPWTNKGIKEVLTEKVRRDKAGDDMVKAYSKGSLEASAKAMGVEPVEVASLKANGMDMNVSDSKVKGRILGSKPSNKVQVVKGDDGVYAFIVTAVNEDNAGAISDEQFAEMFISQHDINPTLVLRGKKKLENNVYKFEAGE